MAAPRLNRRHRRVRPRISPHIVHHLDPYAVFVLKQPIHAVVARLGPLDCRLGLDGEVRQFAKLRELRIVIVRVVAVRREPRAALARAPRVLLLWRRHRALDAARGIAEPDEHRVQRRDGAAHNHEEQFAGDPDEDIVRRPRLVGAVRELGEVLRLDAGADGREDIEAKDDRELHLFGRCVVERPEDGGRDDGETGVGEGIECCSC